MALEALFRMVRAALLIKFVPYRHWSARLGTLSTENDDTLSVDPAILSDVRWAVCNVDRAFGGRFTCLMQAMAGGEMMRRRGYPAEIILGMATSRDAGPELRLAAHAWLRAGDIILLGGEVNDGFREVARYRVAP